MKSMLVLACLLVGACSTAPVSRSDSAKLPAMMSAADPFPVPKAGMTIGGDPTKPLLSVVTDFERVTGVHVVIALDTKILLEKIAIGLTHAVEVPPGRVYATVENLLVEADFVVHLLQPESPIMIGIVAAAPGGRNMRAKVPSTMDLEVAARHPALMTSVVLHLPHVDVRNLSNSMRQLLQESSGLQVIPMGNSDSVVVSGRGTEVANVARMLLAVEESEARKQAEEAKRATSSGTLKQNDPPAK